MVFKRAELCTTEDWLDGEAVDERSRNTFVFGLEWGEWQRQVLKCETPQALNEQRSRTGRPAAEWAMYV